LPVLEPIFESGVAQSVKLLAITKATRIGMTAGSIHHEFPSYTSSGEGKVVILFIQVPRHEDVLGECTY